MKQIHQIYITDNDEAPSDFILNKIVCLKKLYADYDYKMWKNNDVVDFISKNFSEDVLYAYNTLMPYAFKCDLARYCILYKMGGYYFDVAICPEVKYEPTENIMFKGQPGKYTTNDLDLIENNVLFFPKKQNLLLKKAIDKIVENVKWLNYNLHPLDITGPIMLYRLYDEKTDNVQLGNTEITKNSCISYFNNKKIYYHKEKKYQANLGKLGCKGTNNYEKMYFDGKIYNLSFSYCMITNGKKPDVTNMSLKSILINLRENDELLILGDCTKLINHKKIKKINDLTLSKSNNVSLKRNSVIKKSKGNVIITCDDDILFPDNFRNNLIKYIQKNYSTFDTLTTKVFLPSGGRHWDRSIYNKKGDAEMISYDEYNEKLFYSSQLIIWKSTIAKKIPFDETHMYYDVDKDNEDVKLSSDLKKNNYKIKIDTENFVVHFDFNYVNYIDKFGKNTVAHKNADIPNTIIYNKIAKQDINKLIKSLVKYEV